MRVYIDDNKFLTKTEPKSIPVDLSTVFGKNIKHEINFIIK